MESTQVGYQGYVGVEGVLSRVLLLSHVLFYGHHEERSTHIISLHSSHHNSCEHCDGQSYISFKERLSRVNETDALAVDISTPVHDRRR